MMVKICIYEDGAGEIFLTVDEIDHIIDTNLKLPLQDLVKNCSADMLYPVFIAQPDQKNIKDVSTDDLERLEEDYNNYFEVDEGKLILFCNEDKYQVILGKLVSARIDDYCNMDDDGSFMPVQAEYSVKLHRNDDNVINGVLKLTLQLETHKMRDMLVSFTIGHKIQREGDLDIPWGDSIDEN